MFALEVAFDYVWLIIHVVVGFQPVFDRVGYFGEDVLVLTLETRRRVVLGLCCFISVVVLVD